MEADIGVIGLAVMGENLALNVESRGFTVAAYNRTTERTTAFAEGRGAGKRIVPATTLGEFVGSLRRPRRMLVMVKAGAAVDAVLGELVPLLSTGDIVIDGGNSHYADTTRRVADLQAHGLSFVGAGVSGGEEGALLGPSIMPGGDEAAWPHIAPILQAIAARAADGEPCCAWMGPAGAGHFVKMVHNGIEYGDMQMIAEAYGLLRGPGGLSNAAIADAFDEWNAGELESFLVEITAHILRTPDADGSGDLIDIILDAAGQKGTGKWTSVTALDVGVPAPTIAEAVFARCLSAVTDERAAAARLYARPAPTPVDDPKALVDDVRDALLASKICSYAQGFHLMRLAGEEHGYELALGSVAAIWRAGCIIRASLLEDIRAAYRADAALANLQLDPGLAAKLRGLEEPWRRAVGQAVAHGAWAPALTSALTTFDGYRTARLPTSLVQAQRDYFGAHTYERVDRPRGETFHTNWTGHGGTTSSTSYSV